MAAQISLGVTGTGEWAEHFARVLKTVAGDQRYAALATLAASGAFDEDADDTEDAFEFGLARLLDGIDAFVHARAARQRPRKTARRSLQAGLRKLR
jgi:Tetracyclin repressor-like, C-terminal domain